MSTPKNTQFDFQGVNHLALVCRDMAETVKFYRDTLGMPLVKTLNLPNGRGQHFFFDVGNGDTIAFFWFPEAPAPMPGVSAPADLPTRGDIRSAPGSMNHVAINVAADKFDAYYEKLKAKGIDITRVQNHDDSELGASTEMHDGVFVRSAYFFDPDGVCLELAAWTREFDASDVRHAPANAQGTPEESLISA